MNLFQNSPPFRKGDGVKHPGFVAILIAAVLVAGAIGADLSTNSVPSRSSPAKALMRQKLTQAQSLLEGVTREDFPLIAKQARKLRALSQPAAGADSANPEYARRVDAFRHELDAIAKAADERNLDGVTLAYVKVTLSCVECHKFVRGRKTAAIQSEHSLLRSLRPASIPGPSGG